MVNLCSSDISYNLPPSAPELEAGGLSLPSYSSGHLKHFLKQFHERRKFDAALRLVADQVDR